MRDFDTVLHLHLVLLLKTVLYLINNKKTLTICMLRSLQLRSEKFTSLFYSADFLRSMINNVIILNTFMLYIEYFFQYINHYILKHGAIISSDHCLILHCSL